MRSVGLIFILRPSRSGKTWLLVHHFMAHFGCLFESPLSMCKKVVIASSTPRQPIYAELGAMLPKECDFSIVSSVTPELSEHSFWEQSYASTKDFGILILDDLQNALQKRSDLSIDILESFLQVSCHHYNVLLFCLLQSPGGGSAQRLRASLRSFSYYAILPSIQPSFVRILLNGILPYTSKFLIQLLASFLGRRGVFATINTDPSVPNQNRIQIHGIHEDVRILTIVTPPE